MKKWPVIPIIFLVALTFLVPSQASASTVPSAHFDSSPITTWYNQTPYEYAASISAPYNWTLRTNAPLHMSGGNTVNYTAAQTVFGVLSTGKYWVNISISYHNTMNVTTLLTYQNFTLTVLNRPYIYSTPETFFYPDSTYNYTYEINQGNITNYSSGFSLNRTSHTLSQYLSGSSYSFFLTVSDENGTYTQYWGVSSNDTSRVNFNAVIGSGLVNITAPLSGIGVNNTAVFLNGKPIFMSIGLTHPYSLDIVNNTYYVISTNSNASQNATVYFNSLTPAKTYGMYLAYDNGSFTLFIKTLTVPGNGTISFTYDPSVMRLDTVIELISVPIPIRSTIIHTDYKEYLELFGVLLVAALSVYFYSVIRGHGGDGRSRRKF